MYDHVASEQQGPDPRLYQRLLRSVGAYLDSHSASQILVVEQDDGFLLRYLSRGNPEAATSVRLDFGDSADPSLPLGGPGSSSAPINTARRGGRYEDILRAFGYELEHVAAQHIVVDELDGNFVLSYHHLEGQTARKRRTLVASAEAEELLKRARARRRAQPGWLERSSETSSGPVRVVRLDEAASCLDRSPSVLYEYTMPSVSQRTAAILQGDHGETRRAYRGQRSGLRSSLGPPTRGHRLLRPLESAKLISAVYSRCLDPVRFSIAGAETADRGHVVAAFARSLAIGKVLAAVELVAENIDELRTLDELEAGLGTNTVRWMQHLAEEALEAVAVGPSGILPEQARVHRELRTIRESVTVVDRFAAMRRISNIPPAITAPANMSVQ